MSHSHSSLLDHPLFSHTQHHLSLLPPCHSDRLAPNPQTAGLFRHLAIHSPLTGCEPDAIVEISNTEVTPIHRPSRRTSVCSVYNSGEDVTSAPVLSEVEGRQSIGRLASPLPMQKRVERSKCNPREKLITLKEKVLCHAPSTEKLVVTHSHKRKSSRDSTSNR